MSEQVASVVLDHRKRSVTERLGVRGFLALAGLAFGAAWLSYKAADRLENLPPAPKTTLIAYTPNSSGAAVVWLAEHYDNVFDAEPSAQTPQDYSVTISQSPDQLANTFLEVAGAEALVGVGMLAYAHREWQLKKP